MGDFMRKILILYLILFTVFTLVACSENTVHENTPPVTTPDIIQPQETPDNTQPQDTVRTVTVDGVDIVAGEVISSGTIMIDGLSFIELDPLTEVVINDISENNFSLSLLEGSIFADITQRSNDDIYEINVIDTTLKVSGTEFIAGFDGKGNPVFIMLEGSGEVDGVQLTRDNIAIAGEDGIIIEHYKDSNNFVIFAGFEWYILNNKTDTALIISSSNMLGIHPYHAGLTDITWEHSDIRAYLNNTFYDNLSPAQQLRIQETSIINDDNQRFEIPGGNDTVDKIFLLSIDEAESYLSQGYETFNTMLRSPGSDSTRAALFAHGDIYYSGNPVINGNAGLRPAIWITLEYNDVILRAMRVLGRDFIDIDSLPAITPAPIPPELAYSAWIMRDLSEKGITNEQLADMVASGQIPSNVHYLNLSKNPISDLTPLSELTELRSLDLGFIPFIDLTPLSGLTNLFNLSFGIFAGEGSITDITPLSGLTNLVYLNMHGHLVSDITPLRGMTNLEGLYAGDQVRDLTVFSKLTSLSQLSISGKQIRDITPLQVLTNMRQLSIYNSQINDLSPISNMTDMSMLDITYAQVSDLTPLAGMTNMWNLNISGNQVTDLNPLHGLTKLENVSLRGNPVADNQEQIDALQNAIPNIRVNK